MKRALILHPFLFAVFPILFLTIHNIDQVSISQAILPSLIILDFTLLLLLFAKWIFKDAGKAGIIVSIGWILFFSYGHIRNAIPAFIWQLSDFEIGINRCLAPICGILFIFSVYFIMRIRRNLYNFTNILNIIALSVFVMSLINIGAYKFKTYNWKDIKRPKNIEAGIVGSRNTPILPDIYYIILDGYARSDILEEIYGYDNQKFAGYLTRKGFYIASKSQSNYAATFLSLASSLNMEYVNYLSDRIGLESNSCSVLYNMVSNSKVMYFLKSKGYTLINFNSGCAPTDHIKYADLEFRAIPRGEFIKVLIQMTMLEPFLRKFLANDARERILYTFLKLAEVPKIKGPKFTLAHIVCPHPPYVFGRRGESVPEAKLEMSGDVWKQKENYLNQLIFVNEKVEALVEKILSETQPPPIIILQADHGPAVTFYHSDTNEDGLDNPNPSEIMIRERFGIFNAYYLPSGGDDLLYDSITPVNTFRLIFNFYFNMNEKLLNDQSYYSSYKKPYKFINVTDSCYKSACGIVGNGIQ